MNSKQPMGSRLFDVGLLWCFCTPENGGRKDFGPPPAPGLLRGFLAVDTCTHMSPPGHILMLR